MASSMPYMPVIGAICTARRLKGDWRVVSHIFDGLVMKCVLQSIETGETTTRFTHEITEKSSSSYGDLTDFLRQVAGISEEDLSFLDEPFEVDENTLLGEAVYAPGESSSRGMIGPVEKENQPPKRFKPATDTDINQLKAQNTEITTDRQTKWAVKLLKGI